MKLIYGILSRNLYRRSLHFRYSAGSCCMKPSTTKFLVCTPHTSSSTRFYSSSSKDDGNEPDSSSTGKAADDSTQLKLTKPGGMGKAGELRKAMDAGDVAEMDGKKRRRPLKSAMTSSKEDESSTSDDELMSSESSSSDDERAEEKPSQVLTPALRHAVKDVSKSLGGDERRTRLDLLKKLMQHEKESYKASKIEEGDQKEKKSEAKASTTKLGSLLGGMKVQKGTERGREGRRQPREAMGQASEQLVQRYKKAVKEADERSEPAPPKPRRLEKVIEARQYGRTDLFDRGPGLGIFIPVADKLKSSPPLMPVWENLERRRLKQLTTREPRNGFEEFIRWTEEGKMHPYPIDNDYGHVEQNVSFHEHVFLEDQLEDGFPKTGPIRHFMELVVHGLSSNPYTSVEKKHGHIAWFRDYFKKRGAEIEKLHALDLKHQQALAEIEAAASSQSKTKDVSS